MSNERKEILQDIKDMARRIGYPEYKVHVLSVRIHNYPVTKLKAIQTEFITSILDNRPVNEKELFMDYHRRRRPSVLKNKEALKRRKSYAYA